MRLLINIGTSGKYRGERTFGMSDYLIRHVLMNCIIIFGFFILLALAVINFREEAYLDAVFCIAMALVCIVSFVLGRTKVPQSVVGCIFYPFYGLMCIVLVRTGEAQEANFMFVYLFPLLAIMQFGMLGGTIASTILITVRLCTCLSPGCHISTTFLVFQFVFW